MCTQCEFKGQTIQNVGDWRKLFGEPVFCDPTIDASDKYCLCSVDIEASAEEAGLTAIYDDASGDYELS